jgi:hypothetical protein
VLQGVFVDFTTVTNFTKLFFVRQMSFCCIGSSPNESPACRRGQKLIDKNYIIDNSAVDRPREISGVNPLLA